MVGYFRKFFKNHADIAGPVSGIVRTKRFEWRSEQREAFEALKEALLSASVLVVPKMSDSFVETTDISKFVIEAIIEQDNHPFAYLSRGWQTWRGNATQVTKNCLPFLIAL